VVYLLQYIFFWLLASAVIGGVLAWYLRGAQLKPQLDEARADRESEADRRALAESEAGKLREQAAQLRQEAGMLEASVGTWSAKSKLWEMERERLFGEAREAADKLRELDRDVASWKAQSRAWESERKVLLTQAESAEQWRSRYEDLRLNAVAALAAPKAMAMSAAAGAGAGGSTVAPSVEDRFLSFVLRTQNEGWGDIERLEGLGAAAGQRLRAVGIAWVKDLLAAASDASGRERLAAESGLAVDDLTAWVRSADLLRVEGVTPAWAQALASAGLEGVGDLARQNPDDLMERLGERDPGVRDRVAAWIARAVKLAAKVS
jgi:hypothetical protein